MELQEVDVVDSLSEDVLSLCTEELAEQIVTLTDCKLLGVFMILSYFW